MPAKLLVTVAVVLALLLTGSAGATTVIADFTADFQGSTPKPGWSYQWNQNGAIGNPANYSPLLYDSTYGFYDFNGGASGFPASGSPGYVLVGKGSVHPGRGSQQNSLERFSISAFTVPSNTAGVIIQNLSVNPNNLNGPSDGVDLFIHVDGNAPVLVQHIAQGATYAPGPISLGGNLSAGQTVYVAIGSAGTDSYDGTALQYQLVPEPASCILFAVGAAGLCMAVRRRRRLSCGC